VTVVAAQREEVTMIIVAGLDESFEWTLPPWLFEDDGELGFSFEDEADEDAEVPA
jgi:hypothetical protein